MTADHYYTAMPLGVKLCMRLSESIKWSGFCTWVLYVCLSFAKMYTLRLTNIVENITHSKWCSHPLTYLYHLWKFIPSKFIQQNKKALWEKMFRSVVSTATSKCPTGEHSGKVGHSKDYYEQCWHGDNICKEKKMWKDSIPRCIYIKSIC